MGFGVKGLRVEGFSGFGFRVRVCLGFRVANLLMALRFRFLPLTKVGCLVCFKDNGCWQILRLRPLCRTAVS